jgi:hypothetical protein
MNSVGGVGMLGWFFPKCNVPSYQLNDRSVAVDCGRKKGLMSAVFYAAILLIAAGGYTYYVRTRQDDEYEPYVSLTTVWTSVAVLALVLVLGLPMIDGFFGGNSFDSVQFQIQNLMDTGMSRLEAQREIGRTARAMYQAGATQQVGTDILAAGLLSGAIQGAMSN